MRGSYLITFLTIVAPYVKIHLSTKVINPSHLLRSANAQYSLSFRTILSFAWHSPSVVNLYVTDSNHFTVKT
jgi:hypothetical protein